MRWFLDTTLNSPSLTFGYAQIGQENSFGWAAMEKGLTDQVSLLATLSRDGKVNVETLETSAKRYRSIYDVTPASAVTALSDWKNEGRSSVWYSSRFYRINMFWENGRFTIRDIRLFDEDYSERYLESICEGASSTYDTLPILDGILWSNKEAKAEIRLMEQLSDGETRELPSSRPSVTEDFDKLIVEWESRPGVNVHITCSPETWTISVTGCDSWLLDLRWAESKDTPIEKIDQNEISYTYENFPYAMKCLSGEITHTNEASSLQIHSDDDGTVSLGFVDA